MNKNYKLNFLSLGASDLTAVTTPKVMLPPKITEGIKPINFAATPDSNDPNSLDEPINIPLTADTLPRISSGVYNWIIVLLIITLTLSTIPLNIKKNSAR